MKHRLTLCMTITAIALIAGACSFLEGDGVTDLKLEISVAKDVNPDDNGRPSPVFLRVIELREAAGFRNATYLDLYQDAERELGGAYLGSNEIGPLYPDSGTVEELRLNSAAGAVGILGEFNRYADMENKAVFEFEPGNDAKVRLRIDGEGIRLD